MDNVVVYVATIPKTISLRSGMAPTAFDKFRVSLKSDTSVPGLADVGVLHGDGDGPRAPPRCQGGLEKISND